MHVYFPDMRGRMDAQRRDSCPLIGQVAAEEELQGLQAVLDQREAQILSELNHLEGAVVPGRLGRRERVSSLLTGHVFGKRRWHRWLSRVFP